MEGPGRGVRESQARKGFHSENSAPCGCGVSENSVPGMAYVKGRTAWQGVCFQGVGSGKAASMKTLTLPDYPNGENSPH